MKPLYSVLLFSSVVILFSNSCHKGGPCEEPLDLSISTITINFKDAQTNKYLYEELNPIYDKDSLKIIDNFGNQPILSSAQNQIPNSPNRYYVIGFSPVYNSQSDQHSFNTELCKSYTIKYTYNEIDSIRVCFKSKYTKCGSVFETIRVFHNGGLIGSKDNDIGLVLTVYKN